MPAESRARPSECPRPLHFPSAFTSLSFGAQTTDHERPPGRRPKLIRPDPRHDASSTSSTGQK